MHVPTGERSGFVNKQGLRIHFRIWDNIVAPIKWRPPAKLPVSRGPSPSSRGTVVIVHGFGEHCGRYEHVAAALNQAGFVVCALDHQGHGQSEGDRCYAERLEHLTDDIEQFVATHVKERANRNPGPLFLLGHSMGGLLAYLVAQQNPKRWAGVVLSGPAFIPDPDTATPFKKWLARTLSSCAPKLPIDPLDGTWVSRSTSVVTSYQLDPLVYAGGIRIRMGAELLKVRRNTNINERRGLIG